MRLELYLYDTWGNAEDGYDVNNVFKTSTLEVDDSVTNIVAAFVAAGDIDLDKLDSLHFEDLYQDGVWLEIEAKEDGKPLGRIVQVK